MKVYIHDEGDYSECDVCNKEISIKCKMIYIDIEDGISSMCMHYKCGKKVKDMIQEALDTIKRNKLIKKIVGI